MRLFHSTMLHNATLGVGLLVLLGFGMTFLVSGCGGSGSGDGTEDVAAADSEDAGDDASADDADAAQAKTDQASTAGEEQSEGTTRKRRERSSSVNAARVMRGELVVPVIAEGTIRARRTAEIRTEIAGRIERFFVDEGVRVRKGDKIASLDDREYRIALEEARARYLNALAAIAVEETSLATSGQVREFQDKLDEIKAAERRGEITRDERRARELDLGVNAMRDGAYRRELIEARTGLSQARADAERARLNLERSVIVAPFSGVISNLTLTAGHHLSTGEVICSLVDNVDLEAEVGVLESDLAGVEVGRPAIVVVPALEESLRVQVDVVSPNIDSDSRTCRVLLRVRNEDGRLQPGMFVRAAIAGRIHPDKLMVPVEAILTRDGRPLLFKVEEDQAKWVYVQIGLRNDRFVEIERVLQGGPLDEGSLVVVSDHLTLSHDARVRVKKVLDMTVAWAKSGAEE